MLSRIKLTILMALMNFHLICVRKFSRPSKKDTSTITTGEVYEKSQHQPHDDLEVQANDEKDLEQNRPGMTKFRSSATKKRKPKSEEVSKSANSLKISVYIILASFLAHG